jgi:hypothetical protein
MNEQEEQKPTDNQQSFTPIHHPVITPIQHSGLGIASFIMAIVSIISFIGLTISVVVLVSNTIDLTSLVDANGNRTMTDAELMDKLGPLIAYLILYPLLIVIVVIGLILGIVGLARQGYKKVFAVIGTVLNGLFLLSVFLLMIIGLATV